MVTDSTFFRSLLPASRSEALIEAADISLRAACPPAGPTHTEAAAARYGTAEETSTSRTYTAHGVSSENGATATFRKVRGTAREARGGDAAAVVGVNVVIGTQRAAEAASLARAHNAPARLVFSAVGPPPGSRGLCATGRIGQAPPASPNHRTSAPRSAAEETPSAEPRGRELPPSAGNGCAPPSHCGRRRRRKVY
ncbi:hypothetical protein MTO96_011314 [Rhipicephalus appendiculatus]